MVSYRDDGVQGPAHELGVRGGGACGDELGVALEAGPDDEVEGGWVDSFLGGEALDLAAGGGQHGVVGGGVGDCGDGHGAELVELEEVGVVDGEVDQEQPDGQQRLDGVVVQGGGGAVAELGGEVLECGLEQAGFGREVLVAGGGGHAAGAGDAGESDCRPPLGVDEFQGGLDEALTGVSAAAVQDESHGTEVNAIHLSVKRRVGGQCGG